MDPKANVPSRTAREFEPYSLLRREMDRLFDSFALDWPFESRRASSFLVPKVDLAETDDGLEITADLPGIDPGDVTLDLTENVLTLKAEHKSETEEKDEKKQYHYVERSRGSFMRRFELPFEADADRVEAHLEQGVLKVSVPHRADAERPPRKIEIKGGH